MILVIVNRYDRQTIIGTKAGKTPWIAIVMMKKTTSLADILLINVQKNVSALLRIIPLVVVQKSVLALDRTVNVVMSENTVNVLRAALTNQPQMPKTGKM